MKDSHQEKPYMTIREAASMVGVEPHVLRFWEKQFPKAAPMKQRNRRYYSPDNIAMLMDIKTMRYQDHLTIKAAQKHMRRPLASLDWAHSIRQLEEAEALLTRLIARL